MNMKVLTILFFNFAFCVGYCELCFSQTPSVKAWDYRYGGFDTEYVSALQQTTDGGYILGGYTYSGMTGDKTEPGWGLNDYWVVKLDSLGNKQWDKDLGGTNDDNLYDIKQTSDGGYILGGYSFSGISGNKTQPLWGQLDFWIVKLDSFGAIQWDKDFGGTKDDVLQSLMQTSDGGYILGGRSGSGVSGDKTQPVQGGSTDLDYWIVKIDSAGNKQWDKDFGGTDPDLLFDVKQTADGGYILGGYSHSMTGGDKTQDSWGLLDYWIVKTDSLGNKQWDMDYGGTDYDHFVGISQTNDGGYILGGLSYSGAGGNKSQPLQGPAGDADYWIIKTDALGVIQWDKSLGGTLPEVWFGNISQTTDGGYLMAGSTMSDIGGNKTENNLGPRQTWILKTDSLGSVQWDKTIFSPDIDMAGLTIETREGCYVTVNMSKGGPGGYKTQPAWNGFYDFWIVKLCDSTVATSIASPVMSGKPHVYPNPAGATLFVNRYQLSGTAVEISVYDMLGEKKMQIQEPGIKNQEIKIDVSNFETGIYIIEFTTGSETVRAKFIKE